MLTRGLRGTGYAVLLAVLLGSPGSGGSGSPQTSKSRIEAALGNMIALDRPGQEGLATIWDGNKYIQCRRIPNHSLRCEAAGALMQPSLGHVLIPERIGRLAKLGWRLDPSFGNYLQTFAADMPVSQVADRILEALAEGYDADLANLEVQSDWIAGEPCPPRNGPTQNLAGMINDAPAMAATAIHACAYTPAPGLEPQPSTRSATELINVYGTRVTGEIQRLRFNIDRRVFVALNTDAGYVQCEPQPSPRAVYCEAQSADSWPVLASVLTPERVARLHAAGFADPGRAPNYWKTYPVDEFDDTAIARELLTILHDVYGYNGSPKLTIATEKGG
jgi:hypothetical protein